MNLNASGENHTTRGFYCLISNYYNLLKPQISNRTQYEEYYYSAIIMVKKGFAIMIGIAMNSIIGTKKCINLLYVTMIMKDSSISTHDYSASMH
jgi:hypothetical protein